MSGQYVSTQRLERALRTAAKLVAAPGGEEFAPFFERIERELAARRRTADVRERARALLRTPSAASSTPTHD